MSKHQQLSKICNFQHSHQENNYTVPSQQITGKKTPTFLRVHCHQNIYIYIEIQVGSYLNNDNLIDYRSSVDTSFSVGIVAKCHEDLMHV